MIRLIVKRGDRYGNLIVIKDSENLNGLRMMYCKCDCGNTKIVSLKNLRNGCTKSCGCLHRKGRVTHGMSGSSEYKIWQNMKYRCLYPTHPEFIHYGGRGIGVCDRWRDFAFFFEDMGRRPSRNHTLDRIDNDGDYCPENCQWSTWVVQQRNRGNNRVISMLGVSKSLIEWVEELGINYKTVYSRLARGWTAESALLGKLSHPTSIMTG